MLLEWNARLVRTAGLCYCKLIRKNGMTTRTSKIALSTKVITSPDRLRDTLIHEMCHAAVWLLNNESGGHGPFWKAWFVSLVIQCKNCGTCVYIFACLKA